MTETDEVAKLLRSNRLTEVKDSSLIVAFPIADLLIAIKRASVPPGGPTGQRLSVLALIRLTFVPSWGGS